MGVGEGVRETVDKGVTAFISGIRKLLGEIIEENIYNLC